MTEQNPPPPPSTPGTMKGPKIFEPGTTLEYLDRYELVGELASGGMASVFLARLGGAGGFQRFVAIKRLHPHLANETQFVEMFLDEARLAAQIRHPHVVPILEVGTSEAGYYVVMEYIEGCTFGHLIAVAQRQEKKVPYGVTLKVAIDTLGGLQAAHDLTDDDGQSVNLVHRDVSPQNILMGADGSARLTDFGVARASSRLASTQSGQLKGKLAYMAPEQARGGDLDHRADVFAMAIVIWEALTARRLFKGKSELQTLNRVLFEPVPELREHNADIPEPVAKVIMSALAREPEDRPQSASAFAEELEKAARSCMEIASIKECASYVESAMGDSLSQQRDALRHWLANTEVQRASMLSSRNSVSGSLGGVGSGSVGGPSSQSPQSLGAVPMSQAEPKSSKIWMLAPVALLLLLGGVAIGIKVTSKGSANAGEKGAATPAATKSAPSPTKEPPPAASATASETPPPAESAAPAASKKTMDIEDLGDAKKKKVAAKAAPKKPPPPSKTKSPPAATKAEPPKAPPAKTTGFTNPYQLAGGSLHPPAGQKNPRPGWPGSLLLVISPATMDAAERKRQRDELLSEVGELFQEHLAASEWGRLLVYLEPEESGVGYFIPSMDVDELRGDERKVEAAMGAPVMRQLLPVIAKAGEALATLGGHELHDCHGVTFVQDPSGFSFLPGLVRAPSPELDQQSDELISQLQQAGEELSNRFSLASYTGFEMATDEPELRLMATEAQGKLPMLRGRARLLGTYSHRSRAFHWAWANGELPACWKEPAAELCDNQPERGYWEWTTPQFCTEPRHIWVLCARVWKTSGGLGIYRAQDPEGELFFLLDDLNPNLVEAKNDG